MLLFMAILRNNLLQPPTCFSTVVRDEEFRLYQRDTDGKVGKGERPFEGRHIGVSPDSGTLDSACFKKRRAYHAGSCNVTAVGRE